jgi:hypothetical protein
MCVWWLSSARKADAPNTSLVEKSTRRSSPVRDRAASSTLAVPTMLTRMVSVGRLITVSMPAMAAQWITIWEPAMAAAKAAGSSTSPFTTRRFGCPANGFPLSASRRKSS